MLTANIEIKLTVDGTRWYGAACSANIENTTFYAISSDAFFLSNEVAITERIHQDENEPVPRWLPSNIPCVRSATSIFPT